MLNFSTHILKGYKVKATPFLRDGSCKFGVSKIIISS